MKTPLYVAVGMVVVGIVGFLLFQRYEQVATPPEETMSAITVEPTVEASVTPDPALSSTYTGTLPCADCDGIATELTLTKADTFTAEGQFTLKETYLGRSSEPFISTGIWTTLRGTPTDINAVVYQLNPDKLEEARYYLKISETEVQQLDQMQNTITGPFNYSLKTSVTSPVLSPETERLVGVWRSEGDKNFTREFRADGTATDTYEGPAGTSQNGKWSQVVDPASEPVEIPAVGGATFIKMVMGVDTFYYAVHAASTPDNLILVYLDGNGNLTFTRER